MTIKSFYIRNTPDMTDKQVAEVFDKAVACGAQLGNGVEGFHSDEQCTHAVRQPNWYSYFGVTTSNHTWISDVVGLFGEEITLDQVDEWLGIAKHPTVAERMAALIERLDFPAWGRFISVNENGYVILYSDKPTLVQDRFELIGGQFCMYTTITDQQDEILCKNWRETLTELPREPTQEERDAMHEALQKSGNVIDKGKRVDLNREMLERDERKRSQAEKDYDLKILDADVKKMVIDYRKELTIPSTLPTEQAMPMMLGGEFGGEV